MIIFDDLYMSGDEIADLRNKVMSVSDWQESESHPSLFTVSVDMDTENDQSDANFYIKKLDAFAHRNRIDIKSVDSISLIKMIKQESKEDLEHNNPEVGEDDGSLVLFISLSETDAHTYIFNEKANEVQELEDLTVFTLFSPYAGRGFIVFPNKYFALSMPSKNEDQYMIKITFKGNINSNQASTVFDMQ